MKKLGFILFLLFAATFFFSSCTRTFNIEINDIGTYPRALFEPLPIKVGVYYDNDFSTFETTIKKVIDSDLTFIENIKMGKANIALFNYILSTVFEKVTPVQYLSNGSDHKKDIDLIIEPTVHGYTYSNPYVSGAYIHIIYVINFYLPEGEKISSWWIKGSGDVPPGFESETGGVIRRTQSAMRQVAVKFITRVQ